MTTSDPDFVPGSEDTLTDALRRAASNPAKNALVLALLLNANTIIKGVQQLRLLTIFCALSSLWLAGIWAVWFALNTPDDSPRIHLVLVVAVVGCALCACIVHRQRKNAKALLDGNIAILARVLGVEMGVAGGLIFIKPDNQDSNGGAP